MLSVPSTLKSSLVGCKTPMEIVFQLISNCIRVNFSLFKSSDLIVDWHRGKTPTKIVFELIFIILVIKVPIAANCKDFFFFLKTKYISKSHSRHLIIRQLL